MEETKKDPVKDFVFELENLPITDNHLMETLKKIESHEGIVAIQYKNCHLESNRQILDYLCNIGVKNASILVDFSEYETCSELLKEYIKFDRPLNIVNFHEALISILYPEAEKESYLDETFKAFCDSFREKNQEIIDEIQQVLFGLQVSCYALMTENKEYVDLISSAPIIENPKIVGPNVLYLKDTATFTPYFGSPVFVNRELSDFKNYEMYGSTFLNHKTLVFNFIEEYPIFNMVYCYNQIILHPEKKEALQEQLNAVAKTVQKKGK